MGHARSHIDNMRSGATKMSPHGNTIVEQTSQTIIRYSEIKLKIANNNFGSKIPSKLISYISLQFQHF